MWKSNFDFLKNNEKEIYERIVEAAEISLNNNSNFTLTFLRKLSIKYNFLLPSFRQIL